MPVLYSRSQDWMQYTCVLVIPFDFTFIDFPPSIVSTPVKTAQVVSDHLCCQNRPGMCSACCSPLPNMVFSTELLSNKPLLSLYQHVGDYSFPCAGLCILSFFNFIRWFLACSSTPRSLLLATLSSGVVLSPDLRRVCCNTFSRSLTRLLSGAGPRRNHLFLVSR